MEVNQAWSVCHLLLICPGKDRDRGALHNPTLREGTSVPPKSEAAEP